MKVETKFVRTKAFSCKIRIQNGRVVATGKVLSQFEKRRFQELSDWLDRNHPDWELLDQSQLTHR